MRLNEYGGLFVAFDGPNGVGKSTLVEYVQKRLIARGFDVCVTKEPSNTIVGIFTQKNAEFIDGESLACLVAADRYYHLRQTIIPELKNGKIVITDRYVLSSLILQCMDNVDEKFIININDKAILPDIQVAIKADAGIIQSRLKERDKLTRFERGQRTTDELAFMKKGEAILVQRGVFIVDIDNSANLQENISSIIKHIVEMKR